MFEKIWTEFSKPKCSIFPPFCYYSHDIEDETDPVEEFQVIGGGDFVNYNSLLLWLLPPLAPLRTQLYILFGFIICIQIGIHITTYLDSRLNLDGVPGTPIPVIIISTYAIIIDVITQNSYRDCMKVIE